jgi:hypothetical protein
LPFLHRLFACCGRELDAGGSERNLGRLCLGSFSQHRSVAFASVFHGKGIKEELFVFCLPLCIQVTAALLANRSKTLESVGASDLHVDPKVKKTKAENLECSICFSTVSTKDSLSLQCSHGFCRDCWIEHLRARLDEGGHNAVLATCPWQGCKCVVPAFVWEDLLSAKEVARYRAMLRDQYALTWKDWKHCPKDDCHNVVSWHGKINVPVNCLCTFRWCYVCQDEKVGDHAPATCEEVAAWLKKFSSESENLLFIRANTRMCPKCRSPIEKNGGCMHMTCRKCRHEFCWICFGDVRTKKKRKKKRKFAYQSVLSCKWKGHSACDSKKPEVQKVEAAAATAKTELERLEHYMHRWESHKKAADIARVDMNNLFDLGLGIRSFCGGLFVSWFKKRAIMWLHLELEPMTRIFCVRPSTC